jgi:NAD/NADP transhydrogenase alpha subunit
VPAGAGRAIHLTDTDSADMTISTDRDAILRNADIVLAVQAPGLDIVQTMKPGALLVCFAYAHNEPALMQCRVDKHITCFAMDGLSSQSALAGYDAVQLGSTLLGRMLPKMTTAAGALRPARALVMGLGLAWPGSRRWRRRIGCARWSQATMCNRKPLNRRDRSVDLCAEGGGNCDDTQPGKTVQVGGMTIAASLNVPSLLGSDASELYATNVFNLLALMLKDNAVEIDWNDEMLAKTVLTHAGKRMDGPTRRRTPIRRRRRRENRHMPSRPPERRLLELPCQTPSSSTGSSPSTSSFSLLSPAG